MSGAPFLQEYIENILQRCPAKFLTHPKFKLDLWKTLICADINHSSKDISAVSRWLLWSADGLGSDGQAFKLALLIETNYFSCHNEYQLEHAEHCLQLDLFCRSAERMLPALNQMK